MTGKTRGLLVALLGVVLTLILMPWMSLTAYADDVPVTKVTLDPSGQKMMGVGDTFSFTASIEPTDATDKTVKWSVNDKYVELYFDEECTKAVSQDEATDTLTVYAKGADAGTAIVTCASSAVDIIATCEVKVVKAAPEVNITTQPKDLDLTYGYTDTYALTVSAEEIDGYDLTYQWFTCKDKSGQTTDEIEGATSSSYTVPMNQGAGTTYYYCVVNATSQDSKTGVAESNVVAVTVNKAAPTITEPAAKTLTYDGSAQELVDAGSANGGTMQYALGTDAKTAPEGGWGTTIPTATDAGTYYVWYKVVGDENHLDSEAKCVTVTIAAGEEPKPTKPTYAVTSGAGTEYAEGSDGTLTFVFKRSEGDEETFKRFRSASVDGRALTRDRDYTATAGSLVIALQPSFLATLATGEHTITVTFDDGGTAEAKFTVTEEGESDQKPEAKPESQPGQKSAAAPATPVKANALPKTGDPASLAVAATVAAAGAAFTATGLRRKRRDR